MRARRAAVAYVLLTGALLRRMLREGLVLRSLVFPLGITTGTLMATLMVATWLRAPAVIAVKEGWDDPILEAAAVDHGLRLVHAEDPASWVRARRAIAGTDGRTVWALGPGREAAIVESALRNDRGAFALHPVLTLPGREVGATFGLVISRLVSAIFALYGVVMGAGMVARDRDDGTLAAELALPVPRWIHGATRFSAATLVIGGFVVPSILVWDALLGMARIDDMLRHAIAACAASTALGLVVMARSGRSGFGGRLAGGLSAAFGLYALGRMAPAIAPYVPIASLGSEGSGWVPLVLSLLSGAAAAAAFGRVER
jgi:hypothetical protein